MHLLAPRRIVPKDNKLKTSKSSEKNREYEWHIVWSSTLVLGVLHIASLYGFYLMITGRCKLYTITFATVYGTLGGLAITAGAHRLWTHQAYKARWPLRLFLAIFQTVTFQDTIYEWAKNHRVHHKYTETDADPHNSNRGFFYSHVGWLLIQRHDDYFEKYAAVDMSDLERDPIVMFQKKVYWIAMLFLAFIIPAWIPIYFWNEDPWSSWFVAAIWRVTFALHFTALINSAAHMWGYKPYDKHIAPTDHKIVAFFTIGEGWHNYHHVFPWDYKAAELGNYTTNLTTGLIDLAAKMGLAYDLKTVSKENIKKRAARTGDGTHPSAKPTKESNDDHYHPKIPVWGWGDEDITEEERRYAEIHKRI